MTMKKRILVIDDEKAIRNSFLLTFEGSEYEIFTADNGEDGIEMVRDNQVDLVFLDLKMPGMDGIETLYELRKINASLVVYIFTAFSQDFFDQLKKAASDGLEFEVVQKPLDSYQLKELVQNIIKETGNEENDIFCKRFVYNSKFHLIC